MRAIDDILKEFQAVKARRAAWEPVWELIARYMLQRKQGFTTTSGNPNDFYSHDDVYDNTAGQALHSMVSSIDGALWKNGARTFRIKKPRQANNSTEIKQFYAELNARVIGQMEHEKAAFGTARQEALLEGGAFGTDAIGVFKSKPRAKHKVEYRALPLKNLYVVEDARGRVVKEFYEFEYTAQQLIGEYGEVARTDSVKALLESQNYDAKLKVLWLVEPRDQIDPESDGPERMSYSSIHILVQDKVVVRESGYNGNPIVVSRFYKNEGWEYGLSPGYNALNPTIELNAFIEMMSKGIELSVLPSWYTLGEPFGNGVIDRSPGKVIPIDVTDSKITGMAPIGQIGTVGNLTPGLKLIEWLTEEIRNHFLVDKLTDLNNQSRMTLGEAQIRNELRADNTGSIFSRQIDEKLTPVIRRTLAILDDEGDLGVIPGSDKDIRLQATGRESLYIPDELLDLMDQGVEIYNIEFISPAARILRAEELRGILSTWQFAAAFSAADPKLMMKLSATRTVELINDLNGSPDEILVSDDEFQAAVQAWQQQQQMMMQIQAAQSAADIAAKNASANQQNAQAEATKGGMNGLTNGGGAGGYPAMVM